MSKGNVSLTTFEAELLEHTKRRFPSHIETMAKVREAKGGQLDPDIERAYRFHSVHGNTQGASGNALIAASDPNSISVVVSEIDLGRYKGVQVAVILPEGQDFSSLERRAEQHDKILDAVERELSSHGLKVPGEFTDILVGDDLAATQVRKAVENEFSQRCLPVPESVSASIAKGNDTLFDEVARALAENRVSVSADFKDALAKASGLPASKEFHYPDGAARGYPDGVGYLRISVSEGAMPHDLAVAPNIVGSYAAQVTHQHKVSIPIGLEDQVRFSTPQARLNEVDKRAAAWEGVFRANLKAGEAPSHKATMVGSQVIANLSSQFSDNKAVPLDELKVSMAAAAKAAVNVGDYKVLYGVVKALETVRDDVGALKCRTTDLDKAARISFQSKNFIDSLLDGIKPQYEKSKKGFYADVDEAIKVKVSDKVPFGEIVIDLVAEHGLPRSVFMDIRTEMNKKAAEAMRHDLKPQAMKSTRSQ